MSLFAYLGQYCNAFYPNSEDLEDNQDVDAIRALLVKKGLKELTLSEVHRVPQGDRQVYYFAMESRASTSSNLLEATVESRSEDSIQAHAEMPASVLKSGVAMVSSEAVFPHLVIEPQRPGLKFMLRMLGLRQMIREEYQGLFLLNPDQHWPEPITPHLPPALLQFLAEDRKTSLYALGRVLVFVKAPRLLPWQQSDYVIECMKAGEALLEGLSQEAV